MITIKKSHFWRENAKILPSVYATLKLALLRNGTKFVNH